MPMMGGVSAAVRLAIFGFDLELTGAVAGGLLRGLVMGYVHSLGFVAERETVPNPVCPSRIHSKVLHILQ